MRTKLGRAPGLALNETPPSNLSHPLAFFFGYTTVPAMLPPYCGIPKFPIALSCFPLSPLGDVTIRLFFSTTNLAEIGPATSIIIRASPITSPGGLTIALAYPMWDYSLRRSIERG